jgi:hypothetical protein
MRGGGYRSKVSNTRERFHGPVLDAQSTGHLGSLVELMTTVHLPCGHCDGTASHRVASAPRRCWKCDIQRDDRSAGGGVQAKPASRHRRSWGRSRAAALSGGTNAWPGMTAREGPDDPSVVAMEECGPLKLDKRRTLEVGAGSSGLAAFGLGPPTPPTSPHETCIAHSVPIGHGRLSRRLKASSRLLLPLQSSPEEALAREACKNRNHGFGGCVPTKPISETLKRTS